MSSVFVVPVFTCRGKQSAGLTVDRCCSPAGRQVFVDDASVCGSCCRTGEG